MLNGLLSIFSGIFDTASTTTIAVEDFLLCVGVALLIGLFLAGTYTIRNRYSRSFLITLGILPAIVCIVIMAVNGNVGVGVAVAGAFSLIRFRSAPGTAKEIAALFTAMAAGILSGVGYLAYAALFSIIVGVVLVVCQFIRLPARKNVRAE